MALREISGASVLYPYLQRDLFTDDVWFAQMLAVRLVTSLGIWFHPDTYARLPIALPHVVRDVTARKRVSGVEQWGSPNESGLLRDDNSLVKGLPRSLTIESRRSHYSGARIGAKTGWVAAHVWQFRRDGERASRHPDTNSFLPNLVWLPDWLAKMSDRPGSFVQLYLQALSRHIYSDTPMSQTLGPLAEVAWSQLAVPDLPDEGLPPREDLNFFADSEKWFNRKCSVIGDVLRMAEGLDAPGFRPTRYRDGLVEMSQSSLDGLRVRMEHFSIALEL